MFRDGLCSSEEGTYNSLLCPFPSGVSRSRSSTTEEFFQEYSRSWMNLQDDGLKTQDTSNLATMIQSPHRSFQGMDFPVYAYAFLAPALIKYSRCILYCGGILLFRTKSVVALRMMVRLIVWATMWLRLLQQYPPGFFLPPTSIISMMNIDFLGIYIIVPGTLSLVAIALTAFDMSPSCVSSVC
jgi:hypothetical protein